MNHSLVYTTSCGFGCRFDFFIGFILNGNYFLLVLNRIGIGLSIFQGLLPAK